jgi:nucleoside-diphosphate-sugar epimerase
MERSADGPFEARERIAAEHFAAAATSAGVRRIVYLGGLVPAGGATSTHIASRLAVERILLGAVPASVAFRASIVIGARSRSFRFLVRLIERLPVLAVPAWRTHRTAPVDERDVIEILARAAATNPLGGRSLDIAGPEIVTYEELIARITDHMLVNRPIVGLRRLNVTPIASRVAAVLAGEEHALIGPLMESLATDLLPRDDLVSELLAVKRHSLDRAIERALRDWEQVESLAAR